MSNQPVPSWSKQQEPDNIYERLQTFTEYFVAEFEAKLCWYSKVLEEIAKKPGTLADVIRAAGTGVAVGVAAGTTGAISSLAGMLPMASAGASAKVGGSVAGVASKPVSIIADKIGAGKHKEKAASLSELVYNFKDIKNRSEVRKILVEASFDIFQSFESQFMRATLKHGEEKRAMMKLARDAVYRVINCCSQKEDQVKALDLELITNGLILGESKKTTASKFIPKFAQQTIRRISKVTSKPGRTVVDKISDKEWNTAELYSKVGLAVENPDDHMIPYKYYNKREEITEPDRYGYRRLFVQERENWNELKEQYIEDVNIEKSVGFTYSNYEYRLHSENLEQKLKYIKDILDYINQKDPALMEERIKEVHKNVREDIREELVEIREVISGNTEAATALRDIIQNLGSIESGVLNLIKQGKEIKAVVERNTKITKQGFGSASHERNQIADKSKRQHEKTQSLVKKGFEKIKKDIHIQKNLPERWNVPPRIADNLFIEREYLDRSIKNSLEVENKIVITSIHGLGGVGKTQLVLSFIHKHEEEYNGVCWFDSKDTGQLLTQYAMFARELKIVESEEKIDIKEQALRVKNWLENSKQKGWLLIYDNAPNYEGISEFIPTKGGSIIITSRYTPGWPQKGISVNIFKDEEAETYIRNFLPLENIDQMKTLADRMGGLPLALAQACAYIKKNNMSILRYLEIYEQKKLYLMSREILPAGSQHDPVFVTWNVTIDKINEESNLATKLLTACAYLESNIPQGLLKMLPEFARDESEDAPFEEVLGVLLSYSMLTLDDQSENISIHHLIQDVIRLQSKNEERNLDMVFKLLKASFPYGKAKLEDYAIQRKLLPHLEVFLSHINNWSDDEQRVRNYLEFLVKMAGGYSNLGNSHRQKELLERALPIFEKHYVRDHFQVAITLGNLGIAYGALGDHNKAKELLERALHILERNNHPFASQLKEVLRALSSSEYPSISSTKKEDASSDITKLHAAVNNGNTEAVVDLLDKGADITQVTTEKGNTVLHIAVSKGNSELFKVLLKYAKQLSPIKLNNFINAKTTTKNPSYGLTKEKRRGNRGFFAFHGV